MKLRFQFLRERDFVLSLLCKDGWSVESETLQSGFACHPRVNNQTDARFRLQGLGLLTSNKIRVEFPPLELTHS